MRRELMTTMLRRISFRQWRQLGSDNAGSIGAKKNQEKKLPITVVVKFVSPVRRDIPLVIHVDCNIVTIQHSSGTQGEQLR
jgi:hypothetical protein